MARRPSRTAALLPLAAMVLTGLATVTGGPSQADPAGAPAARTAGDEKAARASLRISPDKNYIGGQALTFTGNIGARGVQRMVFQVNGNRAGDSWETIKGFSAKTRSDGSFSFDYPAPSSPLLSYRLKSGKRVTPKVNFDALLSDLVLWVSGQDPRDHDDVGVVRAGQPFDISVDTTEAQFRRPITQGLQPIPGRKLTLQERVDGDTWRTIGESEIDQRGQGFFEDLVEPDAGEVVYRVRQENWFQGNNQIGWFPSFPTYIDVLAPGARGRSMQAPDLGAPTTSDAPAETQDVGQGGSDTASQRFRWVPSIFDYAWVLGESLNSAPYRGTSRKKGGWLDYTDGGGRVNKQNGGLILDSKRLNDSGPGDFGTTKATLQVNEMTYGRWETRMRAVTDENRDRDYDVRVELVPAGAPEDTCHTITVASFSPNGSSVSFGVNNGGRSWSGSQRTGNLDNKPLAYAAEVGRDHITWFIEGKPVGTVKTKKAVWGGKLTMRLSMVGTQENGAQPEMNHTFAISDWQRGFGISSGKQVRSGGKMKAGGAAPGC